MLHPLFGGDALFVWAEAIRAGTAAPAEPRSRSQPPWHPSCLRGEDWRERVPGARGALAVTIAVPLPTRDGLPQPSPAAGGDAQARGTLGPWTLSALRLPLAEALPWLEGPVLIGPGLRWGAGWPFWWQVAAEVRALVANGAVAPTVADWDDGGLQVQWKAIPGRAERQVLAMLAAVAPQAALAPGSLPEDALATFGLSYADALVRQLAGEVRELARFRRAHRGSTASPRRFLADLFAAEPDVAPQRGVRPAVFRFLQDPAGVEGPGRLVLRLDEPQGEPEPETPAWRLGVYLESPAEPGVLDPAGTVWAGRDATARVALERGLERAASVVPALAYCLREHAAEARLTTEEAWRLLDVGQDRLARQGVTVRVPAWWRQRPPKARLRVHTGSSGLLSTDALVQFSWEVALGDGAVLSAEEFERLVARRQPIVRLGAAWLPLGPGAAEALAARWRHEGTHGEAPVGRALLMALQAEAEPAAEDDLPVLADEALRGMLAGLRDAPSALPEPSGFRGTLRPYQRRGLAWLDTRATYGLGGILADDMGLGKTVQVLALLLRRALARRAAAEGPVPTLIVCPTSVVANWAAEAERFAPELRVLVHQGPQRARTEGLQVLAGAADLVVTSYPLLLRDAESLTSITWDGVVLDEAQYVKNAHAKQAQAARRLKSRYRFALTGTPVENALADLWSIFTFVQPGYLGSSETFRKRLSGPIERGQDEAALQTLRRLIGPFVLRRTKREPGVADELPEKVETKELCGLTREQAALYEAATRELLERIEGSSGMQRRAAVLLALLRLKQICNHPVHFGAAGPLAGRSGKLERLEALLAEVVAEGQRALVFTQYAAWGRHLAEYLGETLRCEVWNLDGATPALRRSQLVAQFQSGDGAGVFVLSLKAGGAGLNLTAARHVFHYDRWWNPAVERQATDRAYRIGQRHSVQVHALICMGTLEERIDQLLRRKEGLAAGVLDGGSEAWLTELGDAELRQVLLLRRGALL